MSDVGWTFLLLKKRDGMGVDIKWNRPAMTDEESYGEDGSHWYWRMANLLYKLDLYD